MGCCEHAGVWGEKLYEHMYYEKDFTNFQRHEAVGSGVHYAGRMVDVRATMSNIGKAIIKLELYDKMGR